MTPTITPNKAVTIDPAAESERLRNAFDDIRAKAPWKDRATSELHAFKQLVGTLGDQAHALALLMRTELYCPYDDFLMWAGFFNQIRANYRSYETMFDEMIADRTNGHSQEGN